ncbi:unnamed protein product [Urochloa humidicola]
MEGGGATTDRKRKAEEGVKPEADDDGVKQIDVVEGNKHRDGSIYMADAHPLHELFHLADTRETRLKPMRLSNPTPSCHPRWTACRQHLGTAMLQIFSLKLTKLPSTSPDHGGPIHLYGFIAIRDFLDPLRNYVFNRKRDDPFIILDPDSDPFIYLSGPKRGVYLQSRVLIEYDVRIKATEEGKVEDDDLPLIDGAATVSELAWTQSALTCRIPGELGAAVDIRRVLLRHVVEATVDVRIIKRRLSRPEEVVELEIIGCLAGELVEEEIKLFRGVVREPCVLERFVIAARLGSYLFLKFKVDGGAAAPPPEEWEWFAFRVTAHGCASDRRKFGFTTGHLVKPVLIAAMVFVLVFFFKKKAML